jgi:hypothetical protein
MRWVSRTAVVGLLLALAPPTRAWAAPQDFKVAPELMPLQPLEPAPVAKEDPSMPGRPARGVAFFGADFAMASGVAPSALLNVSPFIGWRSPSTTVLAPAFRLSLLRANETADIPGGSAWFLWTVGRLDSCILSWPPERVRLQACGRLEAGTLQAYASNGETTRGWFAAGPVVRAEWFLISPLFLEAEGAAMVHVTGNEFTVASGMAGYEVPLFGFETSAGLGVHFL